MTTVARTAATHTPGLVLAGAIAVVAMALDALIAAPISPVLLAVLLGMAVINTVGDARPVAASAAGAGFAATRILRAGIVLLGAQLSLAQVAEIGGRALVLIALCMTLAAAAVAAAGAALRIPGRTALLIGVGTAVCGNTAIMATAPIVDAEEREVSYAVGTITLFGTLGLLLLPVIGRLLDLDAALVGLWAGLAINDTSQVVAAGAAHSVEARDVATVVKLVRNALMAPILVGIAVVWARGGARRARTSGGEADTGEVMRGVRRSFPMFVLGFLALAGLRSAGVLPAAFVAASGPVASACIVVAIAGVGLRTRIASMRSVGPRPLVVGLFAAGLLAVVSLVLVRTVGL